AEGRAEPPPLGIVGTTHPDRDLAPLALLRPRDEWPRRRPAEQRDELAAFQLVELHSVPAAKPDCSISNWQGMVNGGANQFFGRTRVGHSQPARIADGRGRSRMRLGTVRLQ